jgi:hypothetical protein
MTSLEALPSYFWLTSPGLRKPVGDDVPYTTQALRQDLLRLRNAWEESQASRERDAIYSYLTAVFDLVAWWAAEKRALERAHKALGCGRSLHSIARRHLPQSSAVLQMPPRWKSAPGPNGPALSGTAWLTSLPLSHWLDLSSGKAESTGARSGFVHTSEVDHLGSYPRSKRGDQGFAVKCTVFASGKARNAFS